MNEEGMKKKMMMKPLAVSAHTFLMAVWLAPAPVAAQEPPDAVLPAPDPLLAASDASEQVSGTTPHDRSPIETGSPYRISWRTDGILLAVAGASSAVARAASDARTELTEQQASQLSRNDVNWFDRSATGRHALNRADLSEHFSSVVTLAPLALLADRGVRQDWAVFALMYAETTLIQSAVPTIVKDRYDRLRPFAYNPDLTYEQKIERNPGGAFPSTQATSNFANAVFLSTVFSAYHPDSRWKPYVWIGSLGAAGGIGYLRYASGIHYPSDILAGALIGGAIGYAIPRLHRVSTRNVSVIPTRSAEHIGVTVRLGF